ncbi:hypothetical protein BSYN_18650 [Bacteroides sedimenti]|uniref:Uncharacterized protein n=1 Tax=Bacteroides sedimenti TaxID=2136147 RepID=A0ABN6Z4W5_9BACE
MYCIKNLNSSFDLMVKIAKLSLCQFCISAFITIKRIKTKATKTNRILIFIFVNLFIQINMIALKKIVIIPPPINSEVGVPIQLDNMIYTNDIKIL